MIQLQKIKQKFKNNKLVDINGTLLNELAKIKADEIKDKSIAVAVGSRGIANLPQFVKSTISYLIDKGAKPFIFPAMGSHGGATPQGQIQVLESLGITEKSVGCPIKSSMKVHEVKNKELGHKLYIDDYAWHSDGIIMINRIKPHTAFYSEYESGLVKMAIIGVGKHKMAKEMHEFGVHGLKHLMPKAASYLFSLEKFIGGIALVEDAYDQTMHIEYINAQQIMDREPDLLKMAVDNMPCLPVNDIDILIVDEIGKNLSGTGMDTKIIGRMHIFGEKEPEYPKINQIIIDDLTQKTHGNAVGIGLADIITKKLYDKIDFQKTYENVYTSTFLGRAFIPVVAPTLKHALDYATRAAGKQRQHNLKIVRIKNTLHIDELLVSQSIKQILTSADITDEYQELYDKNGNITAFNP